MDKKQKKREVLFIEEQPVWLSDDNIDVIQRPKYKSLLRFYIINTPDVHKSVRGISMEEYDFNEGELIELIKGDVECWESSGNGSVVRSRFNKAGLDSFPPKADFTERVCFSYTKNDELTCFFGHIRNSLAHGRFNITGSTKAPVVIMEDRNNEGNCSARMVLSLSTLMKWIDRFGNHMKK